MNNNNNRPLSEMDLSYYHKRQYYNEVKKTTAVAWLDRLVRKLAEVPGGDGPPGGCYHIDAKNVLEELKEILSYVGRDVS